MLCVPQSAYLNIENTLLLNLRLEFNPLTFHSPGEGMWLDVGSRQRFSASLGTMLTDFLTRAFRGNILLVSYFLMFDT